MLRTLIYKRKGDFMAIQRDPQTPVKKTWLANGGKVAALMATSVLLAACGGGNSAPPPVVTPPVVVVPPTPPVQAATCEGASEIPFTRFGSEKSPLTLTAQNNFCVGASGESLDFGREIPTFESIVADEERVYYAREPFTSYLSVRVFNGVDLAKLTLPDDQRQALHPEHAFTLGGRHFFIAYNVETSIPSGRQFGQLSEGLSLWRVDDVGAGANAVLSVVPNIDFPGGMEANLYSVDYQNGRAVCQNMDCRLLTVDGGGGVTESALPINLNSADFSPIVVELASDGTSAFALIKREFDDRLQPRPTANDPIFFICPVGTGVACTEWQQGGTPFDLTVTNGAFAVRSATSADERAEMMRFDLERLRQTGVTTLGENNVEGRLAWSAVYYLNGLTTLAAESSGLGASFASLRDDADTRLELSLDLIAEQFGQPDPGMSSKRYSLNRESTVTLLHISRIGRALLRAEELGVYQITQNRDAIFAEMLPTADTLEQVVTDPATGRVEFRIKRDAPFYSDGANTPWNFQNGWTDSLAFLNRVRPDLTGSFRSVAQSMINQFILDEGLAALPNDWNYSGGDFFNGWTAADDISTNTPDFPGDKINTATAHISYRAMDAVALIEADREGFVTLDPALRSHIGDLVDQAYVYPFVMEAFAADGRTLNMPDHLAQSYRRISYAYDLQSAAWVMSP